MKPDWFQEIAARMADEMRELDHEFASLKDYEAGIASQPSVTAMKPDRETLLAAAEWCQEECVKLLGQLKQENGGMLAKRIADEANALWFAAALMREAAMEME